jgi:hypothetical protein
VGTLTVIKGWCRSRQTQPPAVPGDQREPIAPPVRACWPFAAPEAVPTSRSRREYRPGAALRSPARECRVAPAVRAGAGFRSACYQIGLERDDALKVDAPASDTAGKRRASSENRARHPTGSAPAPATKQSQQDAVKA